MENMENKENEYITFSVTASDGTEVELAVIDEFELEFRHYVVAARVIGDEISEDGQFIYRAKMTEDDFIPEKITDSKEYQKVVKAYMEMEE